MEANFLIKKLNTHEDIFHIHKILGGIAIVNYIYRFSILCIKNNMNLENEVGISLLGIHGLLSASSLFFKLSNKRNKMIPIIYPEYRLHNIIFAFRSILCCLSFYFITNIMYARIMNMFICLLTIYCADVITNMHIDEPSTTMRGMPYDNYDKTKIEEYKRMYSSMQLYATYYMLGNINTAFSPMFAIQLSSFLMTLVKKNIIKPTWWHYLYTVGLLKNILLAVTYKPSFLITMNISCGFFYYWRIKKNYNKYLVWSIVFISNYNLIIFFEGTVDEYVKTNASILYIQYLFIFTILYNYKKYYLPSINECIANK